MTTERNRRKVRQGVVVSTSGDKTCVVKIEERKKHPLYGKMITMSKKFHAHDEKNDCGVGDTVVDHGDPPAVEDEALASRRDRREGQVGISAADVRHPRVGRTAHGPNVIGG